MSGTWIIYNNRDINRCKLQSLEQNNLKFLFISVQIDNTFNTIDFNNYDSRYWKLDKKTPQKNNLSKQGDLYKLGKIVIIRE